MLEWLETLPLIWQEDRLVVTHAALDPTRGPDAQKDHTLIWGHPAFLRTRRRDDIWVAHGHTIVETAEARDSRIAVDTGAWRSGRLTAAWLDETGLSFIEAIESAS
jgi:serine/threonine protein phosphatase 1